MTNDSRLRGRSQGRPTQLVEFIVEPFSISCSTCGSRLKVRDESAIGQISLCPKCSSMVMITPPSPVEQAAATVPQRAASDSTPKMVVGSGSAAGDFSDAAAMLADTVDDLPPPADDFMLARPSEQTAPPATMQPAVADPASAPSPADEPDSLQKEIDAAALAAAAVAPPPVAAPSGSISSFDLDAAALGPPPGESASRPAAAAVAGAAALPAHVDAGASPAPPISPNADWMSPGQRMWRVYALAGVASVALLGLAVGLWMILTRDSGKPTEPLNTVAEAGPTEPAAPVEEEPKPEPPDAPTPPTPDNGNLASDDLPAVSTTDLLPSGDEPKIVDAGGDSDAATDVLDGDISTLFPGADDLTPESGGDEPLTPDTGLGPLADLIDGGFPVEEPGDLPPADDIDGPKEREPPKVALPRPTPLEVDIRARLKDKVPGIRAEAVPLHEYLTVMTQLSTVPITLDVPALRREQIDPAAPVNLNVAGATIGQAIVKSLPRGLKPQIVGSQVKIVSVRGDEAKEVRYPLDDLVANREETSQIAALAQTVVRPSLWVELGGAAKMRAGDAELIVTAPDQVQFEMAVFIAKLRRARGQAKRMPLAEPLVDLQTRTAQADEKLQTQVRAIFHLPRPLTRIAAHLSEQADVTLLIDWQALGEEGWPPHTEAKVVADDLPLHEALDKLLTPMDLAWRAVDAGTIQITSARSLAKAPELELHPTADLIDDDHPVEALLAKVTAALGPGVLVADGGPGVLRVDDASSTLICHLPQKHQRQVSELLTRLRETP